MVYFIIYLFYLLTRTGEQNYALDIQNKNCTLNFSLLMRPHKQKPNIIKVL